MSPRAVSQPDLRPRRHLRRLMASGGCGGLAFGQGPAAAKPKHHHTPGTHSLGALLYRRASGATGCGDIKLWCRFVYERAAAVRAGYLASGLC